STRTISFSPNSSGGVGVGFGFNFGIGGGSPSSGAILSTPRPPWITWGTGVGVAVDGRTGFWGTGVLAGLGFCGVVAGELIGLGVGVAVADGRAVTVCPLRRKRVSCVLPAGTRLDPATPTTRSETTPIKTNALKRRPSALEMRCFVTDLKPSLCEKDCNAYVGV